MRVMRIIWVDALGSTRCMPRVPIARVPIARVQRTPIQDSPTQMLRSARRGALPSMHATYRGGTASVTGTLREKAERRVAVSVVGIGPPNFLPTVRSQRNRGSRWSGAEVLHLVAQITL